MAGGNDIGIIPAIAVVFFAFLIAEPAIVVLASVWSACWDVLMDAACDFSSWIEAL